LGRNFHPEAPMARKQQRRKVGKVMHEYKEGKLRSGSGRKVKSRRQAVAIAMSESGQSRRKRPSTRKSASSRSAAGRKSETRKSTTRKSATRKSTARKSTTKRRSSGSRAKSASSRTRKRTTTRRRSAR
jgi:hypothetical protein